MSKLQEFSKVSQLCPTLCSSMDCSLPGSSVHGIFQARVLEWVAIPSPGDLPNPGIKPGPPALQTDALPSKPPGKPWSQKYRESIKPSWTFKHAPFSGPPDSVTRFLQDLIQVLLTLHWLKHASCRAFFQGFSNAVIRWGCARQRGMHTCTAQKYQTLLTHPGKVPHKKKRRQVALSQISLVDNLRNIPFTPQKGSWRSNFNSHIQ